MKTKYFCPYHMAKIKKSEHNAINAWTELMRRGGQAYAECRTESASIYLGAAIEVALLRIESHPNGCFHIEHTLKPLDMLLELYLVESSFDHAIITLSKISEALSTQNIENKTDYLRQLEKYYERLEEAERLFITENSLSKKEGLHSSYNQVRSVHH